jgi:uncharacterized damage-inducible protein DinB
LLSDGQFAALRGEGDHLALSEVAAVVRALDDRIELALAQIRWTDTSTLGEFRSVGRARLPSSVIGCLAHGAEHSMRHVGQLSVTVRVVHGF